MFFKKKEKELLAPVKGKIISLDNVNDPVFSQRMMGDGFAIEINENKFYAPIEGVLTTIFPSGHAYGITGDDGVEILVHIGLDTVNEAGNGFTIFKEVGNRVENKELIIEIDKDYLIEKGYDLTTMIIFTNKDSYKSFEVEFGKVVNSNEVVGTYKK